MSNQNTEDALRLAKLLSSARYECGISQEQMAIELQVSKNTVNAYEKGTSQPSIKKFLDWYRILGKNPMPYILQYMNPYTFEDINATDSDDKISEALSTLIEELTPHQKRCLLYLLYGSYQGDPYAMLQLFVAHAHLPMNFRYSIANMIADTYKMCESMESLKDTSHIMPDMNALDKAIQAGRMAALHNQDGYHIDKD